MTLAWTEKHPKLSQQIPSILNKSPFFPETGNIPNDRLLFSPILS